MISKYRSLGMIALLAGVSFAAIVAQDAALRVASGRREILLQTSQSWNGKPYTHYPTGQPQLTIIRPNVVYVPSGSLARMTSSTSSFVLRSFHWGSLLLLDSHCTRRTACAGATERYPLRILLDRDT
jgi:hypothetical protein